MEKEYVLVTGATSGIGACLVRQLVAGGAPVVACGRNEARLSELSHAGGDYASRVICRRPRSWGRA